MSDGPSQVASPCINVCRIDLRTGWCEGCRRTVEEITRWPVADDAERRRILAALPARQKGGRRQGRLR
jgi:predicted Fe-S protein YdhL (DUF1289 family)